MQSLCDTQAFLLQIFAVMYCRPWVDVKGKGPDLVRVQSFNHSFLFPEYG